MLLHIAEILVWAGFYLIMDCLPDLSTAFYFSAVTYSSLGYGDVVLDPQWRNVSGMEALTGILMAGLSTSFFFAFISRNLNPSPSR
ncbi:MAG: potassium channel family protein [Candidatus Binatia bacterium]